WSPDADSLLRLQPETVAGLHVEGRVELLEVADDVRAELRRRVRVDREPADRLGLAHEGAPALGPPGEEALRAGHAVEDGCRADVAAERHDVGAVGDGDTAEVADVLADGERAVDVAAREVLR